MARVTAEVGSAANSYEILAKLAMGGMAEIFLARGLSTAGVERYVVLKRILRHHANDKAFIAMLQKAKKITLDVTLADGEKKQPLVYEVGGFDPAKWVGVGKQSKK